jgi:hypothetical protein
MHFSPFESALVRRFALFASVAIGCCSSWAQAVHHQPVATAATADAALATVPAPGVSKPMARKPRPQLAVGAAFAPDGSLWLAGINAANQMFVQNTSPPVGASSYQWSAPRVVDTGGDTFSADGENRPKLAFGPHGWVVISYAKPLEKRFTGMIRMVRSDDGGRTFSAPFTVHADQQEIAHSFQASAFDAKGVLHTFWLDKRDGELAPKKGEKSSYIGAAVYRNESQDGGRTFGPDLKLADHSCECCRIAVTPGNDGAMRAMWRHVFDTNTRDHGFAALATDRNVAVVRATMDDWHVDACPHHGPGLAPAAADGFHTVWFGMRKQGNDNVAGVRYGRLNADGSPQPDTVRLLPDERAEHADVMANGLRVAVVWRSIDGMTSTLKAWLSTDGGQTFNVRTLGQVKGDNDFPRLVQQGPRMAVVWRNATEVQVHDIQF